MCDVRIDYQQARVTVGGEDADLTLSEYRIFTRLYQARGDIVTHGELACLLWGENAGGRADSQSLAGYMRKLRRKLRLGDGLRSIYRQGYRLSYPEC